MKQDSYCYPLELVLGFLAVVVAGSLLAACGSLVRVEYQNPKYDGGAVAFTLPKKEGYAK